MGKRIQAIALAGAIFVSVQTPSVLGISFDEDPANGSVLLTTEDGQLVWLKRHPVSQLQGQHTFNVSADFGVTDIPKALAVGDYDGDANGDVLVARSGGDLGDPSKGFLTWVEREPTFDTLTGIHSFNVSPARSIAMGEMGDGLFDDIVVGRDDGFITWCYSNSPTSQTAYHTWNAGGAVDVVIGNFDGDADGDAVIYNSAGFLVWAERTGSNTFTGIHSFNVSVGNSLAIGDADNDGLDDVFVGRDDGFVLWAFKNALADQITSTHSFNAGSVLDIAFGDADDDHLGTDADDTGDVFVARSDGTVLWLDVNPGSGNLNAVHSLLVAGFGETITAIDVGDIDGNGMLDILVGRDTGVGTGSVGWYQADTTLNEIVVEQSFFNVGFPVLDLKIASIPAAPSVFTTPADTDDDGDVDGVDFAVFASCFNKAGNPPRTLGCDLTQQTNLDFDTDGDVDGVDFAAFASCFNKAGNPPRTVGCPSD